MAKMNRDDEVARKSLSNGFDLVAYAVRGEAQLAYRVEHVNDGNLSISVTAQDALAVCAMRSKT